MHILHKPDWQKFMEADDRRIRRQYEEIKKHELSVDPNFFEYIDNAGNNHFPSKKEFIEYSEAERRAIEADENYWREVKSVKTRR